MPPPPRATADGKPRVIESMEVFTSDVFELVKSVPAGRVTTYGDVAEALGSRSVARHVGWAMGRCWDSDVPWWRVINSQGTVSFRPSDKVKARKRKHGGGEEACEESRQEMHLRAEGVVFEPAAQGMQKRKVRDFDDVRWDFQLATTSEEAV